METFFTTSGKIQHIIKSFNLTKTLFVSSVIIGEAHTGKKSLARYLFPNTTMVSGENQEQVIAALASHDELIITNFEKLSNQGSLDFYNKRIIATANYVGNQTLIDDMFAFIYTMPPLQERHEDISYIKELFIKEALSTLMIEPNTIKTDNIPLDLTMNTKSLKKSIYTYLMHHMVDEKDIKGILYHYIHKHLDGNDGYREHLGLYEIPLIQAGIEKFGSQLQLSQVLGINRNTLRKKIHEHHLD
jgi:DNA-binding NtrC family response regulator